MAKTKATKKDLKDRITRSLKKEKEVENRKLERVSNETYQVYFVPNVIIL